MVRALAPSLLGLLLAVLATVVGTDARAHRIEHEVVESSAVVVVLRYADGSPLAFEECEIRRSDTGVVVLRGRTDALGRLAFVPPAPAVYTARALTEDGHGVSFEFDSASFEASQSPPVASDDRSRGVLQIAAGVAIILALFTWLRRFGRTSEESPARTEPPTASPR